MDYRPWFSNILEWEPRVTAIYQHYDHVDVKEGSGKRRSDDLFINGGVEMTPFSQWSAEVEGGLAHTRHRTFDADHLSAQVRYLWLNDVRYDPVSLSTGLCAIYAFPHARHDLSEFYHGAIAGEGYVSVGQESSCMEFWTSRWWAIGAMGIGSRGAPYLRGDITWEKNWWDRHTAALFVNTLWGLGKRRLTLDKPFHGYGLIRHQTVDGGIAYSWLWDTSATLTAAYTYRFYGKNAPTNTHRVYLSVLYPFGL